MLEHSETKKKLAIISSYNEACGNASYTKALSNALSEHFDVSILHLNTDLLRNGSSKLVKIHLQDLCQAVQKFDCVNIQFEAGIFGNSHRSAVKRFTKVAKTCKNLVVTMHRVDYPVKRPVLAPLKYFLKLEQGFRNLLKSIKGGLENNKNSRAHYKAIQFCKKHRFPIVVHTKRDTAYIRAIFDYNLVFDHPLCFYNQDYLSSLAQQYSKEHFCKDFNLSQEDVHLGIFGLISKYKNYETAVRALPFLPSNYKLLIFGKQHPLSIELNKKIDRYLKILMDLILELKLENRVKFLDASEDETFLKALLGCDFSILPYLEVNQGGSGIAALSLETNTQAIFSQNKTFLELQKYAPSSFVTFSIGNYLELAHAIQAYRPSAYREKLREYHQNYNPKTNGNFYKKIFFDNWDHQTAPSCSHRTEEKTSTLTQDHFTPQLGNV